MFASRRSSVLFVSGLLIATATAISGDGAWEILVRSNQFSVHKVEAVNLPKAPRRLTPSDRRAAVRAWQFFETNTQAETGFVNSVEGFPSTTFWDLGAYVLALVAAKRLELIGGDEFHRRSDQLFESLETLQLFEEVLPNKAYDTRTLQMVDYENLPVRDGIGWSALDLGRFLMAMRVLEKAEPSYAVRIRDLLGSWSLPMMANHGDLWGATNEDGVTRYLQEGRLGYEQYAARAAALWGLDALPAASAARVLYWEDVEGVDVPADLRSVRQFQAINPILSEPFILQELELGLDSEGLILADRVYRAQNNRYKSSGMATAVSEDHVDREPHFLYASVVADEMPWAVVSEDGNLYPDLRTLSVKAAFGWDALYDTDYTAMLREAVQDLGDNSRGWPAGLYEKTQTVNEIYTLNTNAVVLEAIHYIAYGPLWSVQ